MAIIKRKDSLDRNYFINDKTGDRVSKETYHRSASNRSAKSSKSKAKSPACSRAGYGVKVLRSSSAGRKMVKCKSL